MKHVYVRSTLVYASKALVVIKAYMKESLFLFPAFCV